MKTWLQALVALAISLLVSQAGAQSPTVPAPASKTATAVFAGGCFWCVEADFEKLPGVISAESGYTGGKSANPTYKQVSAGGTGHTEAVRLTYDPGVVSYAVLLEFFWRHIDPTVKDRQFCDVGNQYRSAIFYQSETQKNQIEASKTALLTSGVLKQIHTEIAAETTFYPAEGYHQDYAKKNPLRYKYYRQSCGRDSRVAEVWGTKR